MMRFFLATYCLVFLLATATLPAHAQNKNDVDRINKWFDDQKEQQKSRDEYWKNIHVGPLQKPGEIQKPGTIQKSGTIEIPTGWKAIKSESLPCQRRFTLSGDTLFEFDKSTLTPHAVSTLNLLVPELKQNTTHPVSVEGHTDAIGSDTYNERLSFKRAETVKNWLSENNIFDKDNIKIKGYGKNRPVAPNTNTDGSDNPPGRQLNRRVEIIINTCITIQPKPGTASIDEKAQDSKTAPEGSDGAVSGKKTWIDDGSADGKTNEVPTNTSGPASSQLNAEGSSNSTTDQKSTTESGSRSNSNTDDPLK